MVTEQKDLDESEEVSKPLSYEPAAVECNCHQHIKTSTSPFECPFHGTVQPELPMSKSAGPRYRLVTREEFSTAMARLTTLRGFNELKGVEDTLDLLWDSYQELVSRARGERDEISCRYL